MKRFFATLLLLLACATARADEPPVFVDSLAPQKFSLNSFRDLKRQGFDHARDDTLGGLALRIVETDLDGLETACRTKLLMKEEEPGSPWLMWRSKRRVQAGDTPWYSGGLSCTDVLCGYSNTEDPVEPLLHDRAALVGIGPGRTRVYLWPKEPSTIGDEGSAEVYTVDAIPGKDYVLVQMWRAVTSEHPCYDGGDHVSSDEGYFMVLRGDSLVQCFRLVPKWEWDSHDDVDGDLETTRTSTLSVSATSIRMDYRVEERQHSPDGDESKTTTKITRRGAVNLAYDPKSGRFRRAKQPVATPRP